MVKGIAEFQPKAANKNIEFFLTRGDPLKNIPDVVNSNKGSLLVTDFNPIKPARDWYDKVASKINCEMQQVDGHNIVPVWVASDKK